MAATPSDTPAIPPTALLREAEDGPWLAFGEPRRILTATTLDAVLPRLTEAREATEAGLWIAGWLAYEAAPAFDPALAAHPAESLDDLPLLHLALHDEPERLDRLPARFTRHDGYGVGPWRRSWSRQQFGAAFDTVQAHLRAGDNYQTNLTLRLRAPFDGDPRGFFRDLLARQPAGCAAYLDAGRWVVASVSPELFFAVDGEEVVCRPMKGTAPRSGDDPVDAERAAALAASVKERAENVMVVDMIRNDLGRVARPGTVRVEKLFEVERYPTVLQMTSTVRARTAAPLEEIFTALFPCASITGAPKVATSRILYQLEPEPRGLYTGAVGWWAPADGGKHRGRWSVAIRTALVDRREGRVEYGVGGGIVADSESTAEWRETETKARVLEALAGPGWRLLETLRWEPRGGTLAGFRFLDEHLERMARAAERFAFPWIPSAARDALIRSPSIEGNGEAHDLKVRLLLDFAGDFETQAEALPSDEPFMDLEALPLDGDGEDDPVPVALAPTPVAADDPFLRHKTTRRGVYDRALEEARGRCPEARDALLVNDRGELTESVWANLALLHHGRWTTPPEEAGLLPGTYRRRLLARGILREGVLTPRDLASAEAVVLLNSVRGARRIRLP